MLVEELEQIPAAFLGDNVQLRLCVDHVVDTHNVRVLQQLEIVNLCGDTHQRGERCNAVFVDDFQGIFFGVVFEITILNGGELSLAEWFSDTVFTDLILRLSKYFRILLIRNHTQVRVKLGAVCPQDTDRGKLLFVVSLTKQDKLVEELLLLHLKRLDRQQRLRSRLLSFSVLFFLSMKAILQHALCLTGHCLCHKQLRPSQLLHHRFRDNLICDANFSIGKCFSNRIGYFIDTYISINSNTFC
mmetsp:Transcript_56058/g.98306  ORF Transcript_56058/g.98306 Transcript_56058/m.98306 type:complete len:244 (-) Transcript_56058:190-921(-)